MQAWLALLQAIANGGTQPAQAAQQYSNARAVHGALAAAAAAAAVTPNVAFANAGNAAAPDVWHVLRCSCTHNNCFKVLCIDSIRRQLRRAGNDPLTCPAYAPHQHMCKTYSPFVVTFYAIVMQLWPDAMIVWDWHDVPQLPRYHFDATVFVPHLQHRHARYEIDGPCHFRQNYGARRPQDAEKDDKVDQWHIPMLRLHVRDQNVWWQKVQQFMAQRPANTHYTQHYVMCLPAANAQRIV